MHAHPDSFLETIPDFITYTCIPSGYILSVSVMRHINYFATMTQQSFLLFLILHLTFSPTTTFDIGKNSTYSFGHSIVY